MRRIPRDEQGAVLVEAAIAVIIILGVGLGGYWISSVVSRYHQVEEAVALYSELARGLLAQGEAYLEPLRGGRWSLAPST